MYTETSLFINGNDNLKYENIWYDYKYIYNYITSWALIISRYPKYIGYIFLWYPAKHFSNHSYIALYLAVGQLYIYRQWNLPIN